MVGEADAAAEAQEHFLEDELVDAIVFGEQNVETGGGGRVRGGGKGRRIFGGEFQGEGDAEGGAAAEFAMDGDGATEGIHEAANDGQAQAATAEAAGGGGIGLDEGVKEAGDFAGFDAEAGVVDGEGDLVFVALGGDAEVDVAGFGELDGVAEDVEQELAEALGVTEDRGGDIGLHDELDVDAFGFGFGAEEGD